jgi:hypothetical protein
VKKWFFFAVIAVVLFGAGYLALSYHAIKFLKARIEKVTGPGLTVSGIRTHPTYLSIRGIRYQEPQSKRKLLEIEEVRIYPDFLSSMKGSPGIRECSIHNPSFFFFRTREGDYTGPWIQSEETRTDKRTIRPATEQDPETSSPIRIHRFRIVKGSFEFEDRKIEGPPVRTVMKEVDLDVKQIQYPMISARSAIELRGKMKGNGKDGEIQATGWIDFKTLDMDAPLTIRGVDVKTFEPYYRKRVTADIAGGEIGLEMNLVIKDRKIDAPGTVTLANLQLGKEGGAIFYIPSKLIVSLLKDRGNQIKARFQMKGDLDDPQFDLQESFLNRVGLSMAEALGFPVKGLGEVITGGSVKGAKGLSEGMKSIGDIFRKKKEPRE